MSTKEGKKISPHYDKAYDVRDLVMDCKTDFSMANVIKYFVRHSMKDGKKDLNKAIEYFNYEQNWRNQSEEYIGISYCDIVCNWRKFCSQYKDHNADWGEIIFSMLLYQYEPNEMRRIIIMNALNKEMSIYGG